MRNLSVACSVCLNSILVAFGRATAETGDRAEVEGVLDRIQSVGTPSGNTEAHVTIADCGQLAEANT